MAEKQQAPALWTPHPRQALFLANPAYECLFGGAAGGGKSDALLMGGLRYVHVPGYAALIVRRTFPELKEIIDRSHAVFPRLGAKWSGDDKRWTFDSGATFEMGYLERYEDVMRYQGRQFAYIAFDEIGQCPEERIWTKLMAWNRTPVKGIQKMMRCSANPGGPGHAWLRRRFISKCDPDGQLYVDEDTGFSRAFVASKVSDNPTIMENDPQYIRQLRLLPETLRRQLLEGDWEAGTGMALEELEERIHVVEPFEVPGHWTVFAGFDWGYRHNWSFGVYAANEDGSVWKLDTIWGRRMLPHEIARAIVERSPVDPRKIPHIASGHDSFAKMSSRGENTPSIAEVFGDEGIVLSRANTDRVQGLNNLRSYLAWRGTGPDGENEVPRLRFFDTPGNRACFQQLEGMVTDERNPEDVMKVDADPDTGEGGDDMYDETRYAMASRPQAARGPKAQTVRAWSPEALLHERDQLMRGEYDPRGRRRRGILHPEFGRIM